MWILISMGVAGEPIALEVRQQSAPPGLTVTWGLVEGCELGVRVDNGRPDPVTVEWDRSTFTPEGAASVGLVPGYSSKFSQQLMIPSSTVPPSSFIEERVYRRDRMVGDGAACIADPPQSATALLSINGAWSIARLDFSIDQAAVDARLAAERKALCEQRLQGLRDGIVARRTWGSVAAVVGLIGTGALVYNAQFAATHPRYVADEDELDPVGRIAVSAVHAVGGGAVAVGLTVPIRAMRDEADAGCEGALPAPRDEERTVEPRASIRSGRGH